MSLHQTCFPACELLSEQTNTDKIVPDKIKLFPPYSFPFRICGKMQTFALNYTYFETIV